MMKLAEPPTDNFLRLVIDTIPTMVWSLRPDGVVDFVNQPWIDYTGISFEEALRKPNSIVHPDDLSRALEKWLVDMRAGASSEDEMRLRRADGEYRWFLVRTVPLRNERGSIIKWYGTGSDIEDRKQAEMQARTLIDAIPQQIWSAPPDGKTDYCNDRWRSYTGLELENIRGYGWQTMVHPDDRERVLKAWRESVASGTPYEQEERRRATDGSYRWFLSLGVPLRDAEGRIVRWYGTNTDIEDRKQAEKALNAQALRYKTLMETSTDSIYVVNENGDLQEANAAFIRERGYTAAEMKDLNIADWDAQWDREQIRERIRRLAGGSSVFETRHRCKDGSVFAVEVCATSVQIKGDRLLLCVTRDITERKRAEDRLREYEKVVEGLEEMIVVVDRNYRYLLANRAFLNYRGMEREQLIGRLVPDVLSPEAFEKVLPKLTECLTGKTIQYEMKFRYPDRGERDLLVSYFPIEGPAGIDRIACVLQDITERKQAEDRLRRSEEKFKALFDLAPVGVAFLDSQLNLVDCNPALERMSRLSREELLGGAWQRRTFLNADGSPRPPGKRVSERAVTEKQLINGIETGAVLDSGEIVWAEVSVAPVAVPDVRAVVIMHDITERKQAAKDLEDANYQLRILSRQLFHIQEEERRHLARELHDEIGQNLTAAKINLKIIAPDVPAGVRDRLDDSVQLLDRLLNQVRELSLDLRPPLLDELGLVPTLRWLVDQQAQRAGLHATCTANANGLELAPDVQTSCFRVAQEAITNIIRHSGAKNFAVELRREEKRLWLSVRDDGAGFDPVVIQQRMAEHSTLGLVSMKERALLARGGFEVHSALGQGTEILAWFPLARGEHPSTAEIV